MKTITTIMLGILLLSCVSSLEIIAGESHFLEVKEVYNHWKVTENLTEVNVIANETGVIITPNKYAKESSFTITFYNEQGEVYVETSRQGGGGGSSYTKPKEIINETINETEEVINDTIEEVEEEIYYEEITEEEKSKLKFIIFAGIIIVAIWGILYLKFRRTTRIRTQGFPQQNMGEGTKEIKDESNI